MTSPILWRLWLERVGFFVEHARGFRIWTNFAFSISPIEFYVFYNGLSKGARGEMKWGWGKILGDCVEAIRNRSNENAKRAYARWDAR